MIILEYRTGKLKAMSATEVIADLRHYLQDNMEGKEEDFSGRDHDKIL